MNIDNANDFEQSLQKTAEPKSMAVQAMTGRYMQEVQGMVFMAKQFPRNQFDSWQRIKEACSRKSLAEVAEYEYPRGGTKVSGPSIRLAEVLAQCWGNISHGVIELEQRHGESTAMAFAWDLETNTRVEKIFTVKHEMQLKDKSMKKLTDPRDIYELVANMGARRQRSCILGVIPKDIADKAAEECDNTLKSGSKEPLVDRLKKLLDMLAKYGVTREMVEKRAGYPMENFTEKDGASLLKVYNSLKDGMASREDFFEVVKPPAGEPAMNDLESQFKAEQEKKKRGKTEDGGMFPEGGVNGGNGSNQG